MTDAAALQYGAVSRGPCGLARVHPYGAPSDSQERVPDALAPAPGMAEDGATAPWAPPPAAAEANGLQPSGGLPPEGLGAAPVGATNQGTSDLAAPFTALAGLDTTSSPGSTPMAPALASAALPGLPQANALGTAPDYGAALAQYYAALAGAPQYLTAGTQALDPLQQAALTQYSLYAAAYAAQATGTGTDAAGATGVGGPSNAWITNRLIEREKARMDRNFDEADKIRAELRQRGVEVDDRLRTWTSRDGRRGHRPNHNDITEVE